MAEITGATEAVKAFSEIFANNPELQKEMETASKAGHGAKMNFSKAFRGKNPEIDTFLKTNKSTKFWDLAKRATAQTSETFNKVSHAKLSSGGPKVPFTASSGPWDPSKPAWPAIRDVADDVVKDSSKTSKYGKLANNRTWQTASVPLNLALGIVTFNRGRDHFFYGENGFEKTLGGAEMAVGGAQTLVGGAGVADYAARSLEAGPLRRAVRGNLFLKDVRPGGNLGAQRAILDYERIAAGQNGIQRKLPLGKKFIQANPEVSRAVAGVKRAEVIRELSETPFNPHHIGEEPRLKEILGKVEGGPNNFKNGEEAQKTIAKGIKSTKEAALELSERAKYTEALSGALDEAVDVKNFKKLVDSEGIGAFKRVLAEGSDELKYFDKLPKAKLLKFAEEASNPNTVKTLVKTAGKALRMADKAETTISTASKLTHSGHWLANAIRLGKGASTFSKASGWLAPIGIALDVGFAAYDGFQGHKEAAEYAEKLAAFKEEIKADEGRDPSLEAGKTNGYGDRPSIVDYPNFVKLLELHHADFHPEGIDDSARVQYLKDHAGDSGKTDEDELPKFSEDQLKAIDFTKSENIDAFQNNLDKAKAHYQKQLTDYDKWYSEGATRGIVFGFLFWKNEESQANEGSLNEARAALALIDVVEKDFTKFKEEIQAHKAGTLQLKSAGETPKQYNQDLTKTEQESEALKAVSVELGARLEGLGTRAGVTLMDIDLKDGEGETKEIPYMKYHAAVEKRIDEYLALTDLTEEQKKVLPKLKEAKQELATLKEEWAQYEKADKSFKERVDERFNAYKDVYTSLSSTPYKTDKPYFTLERDGMRLEVTLNAFVYNKALLEGALKQNPQDPKAIHDIKFNLVTGLEGLEKEGKLEEFKKDAAGMERTPPVVEVKQEEVKPEEVKQEDIYNYENAKLYNQSVAVENQLIHLIEDYNKTDDVDGFLKEEITLFGYSEPMSKEEALKDAVIKYTGGSFASETSLITNKQINDLTADLTMKIKRALLEDIEMMKERRINDAGYEDAKARVDNAFVDLYGKKKEGFVADGKLSSAETKALDDLSKFISTKYHVKTEEQEKADKVEVARQVRAGLNIKNVASIVEAFKEKGARTPEQETLVEQGLQAYYDPEKTGAAAEDYALLAAQEHLGQLQAQENAAKKQAEEDRIERELAAEKAIEKELINDIDDLCAMQNIMHMLDDKDGLVGIFGRAAHAECARDMLEERYAQKIFDLEGQGRLDDLLKRMYESDFDPKIIKGIEEIHARQIKTGSAFDNKIEHDVEDIADVSKKGNVRIHYDEETRKSHMVQGKNVKIADVFSEQGVHKPLMREVEEILENGPEKVFKPGSGGSVFSSIF